MNIRVDLNYPIQDGTEVVFRSPVDCSQVTGLKLYYPENGVTASKEFAFADAHGNNVGDIDHLFAENVAVKVILDVTTGMAFVQNADTNAYIESTFIKSVNGIEADENGNVDIDLPTKLPNPYALTINGTEYDGTKAVDLVVEGGAGGTCNDGFSPIAKVTQTSDGAVITITDKDGTTTATVTNGKDGDDYVLTEADKQEIAGMVNVQGGGGGFIVSPEPPEDTSLLWIVRTMIAAIMSTPKVK